jgi:uncharacterized protein with ParB-like and HNH nuclease domain
VKKLEANSKKLLEEFIREAMGKQFVVPIYQRKYTWTVKNQLVQLMKDLIKLIENESGKKQHFLGTIVYLENKIGYNRTELSIVDGQQRLITMFLIAHAMKVIAEESNKEHRAKEINETYLINAFEKDPRYKQRLFPSVSDDDDYLVIAEEKYDNIDKDSNSNLIQNFIFLKSELENLVKKYNFDRVFYTIKKFSIVYIKLDERDDAQQIFESINSTGERLTASDLIRNFIMMDKPNEIQTNFYNLYWHKLENVFKNSKEMEEFFRCYLATIEGKYSANNILYQAFKDYWNKIKNSKSEEILLEELVRYSSFFNKFYFEIPDGKHKEIFSDFQSINSRMSAPFVLGLSEWFYDKKINEEQYFEILRILNNYQIRRYFNGDNTSGVSKAFPTYLNSIKKYAEKFGYTNITDIVIYVLITQNQSSNNMAMPTDKSLKAKFSTANAYNYKLTPWLLEKIENCGNSIKVNMENLTLEHIMPQKSTQYWEEKAGVKGEEYTELVNTIGNLALVSKSNNSSAGNRSFEKKKKIFEDTLHLRMNKNLYEIDDWNYSEISKRSEKIVDKLISMYPYLRSKGDYKHDENRNIFIEESGIKAEGYLNSDNKTVTIKTGSEIYIKLFSNEKRISEQRQELLDNEIIEKNHNKLYFVQDYTFSSVSAAASFILGGARNGWKYWKDSDGTSIEYTLRKK